MKIIDLSHTLENNLPVFPGDDSPLFEKVMTHKKDGAQVIGMKITTHHGTHLDCPRHFFEDGNTADASRLENFFGKALMVDCRNFKKNEHNTLDHIKKHEAQLRQVDWVFIKTGWDKYWGTQSYFDNFPVLSVAAAEYLKEKNVKGIGLDVISIDAIDSVEYPIHNIILGNGIFILENLTNFDQITREIFRFAAFPLKVKDGDGSPVRAVAFIDDVFEWQEEI